MDMSAVPFAKGLDAQPGYLTHIGSDSLTCENGLTIATAQSGGILKLMHAAAEFFVSADARIRWLREAAKERLNLEAVKIFSTLVSVGVTSGVEVMLEHLRLLESQDKVHVVENDPKWMETYIATALEQEEQRIRRMKPPIPEEFIGTALEMARTNIIRGIKLAEVEIRATALSAYVEAIVTEDSTKLNANKPEFVDEYSIYLSHSVKEAGYGVYIQLFQSPHTQRNWSENLGKYFKFEQFSYSWMSPGVSLFENLRARGVKVMKSKLSDLSVPPLRLEELALSWLEKITQDYGHVPSVEEIDSWIYFNWQD